jgi:dTDP-4-amino-4,6-dideoxygalactose transaminase
VADEPIRLAWPDVGAAEANAVAAVLEDGMLTMGPRVEEFERELARVCETWHAVAVSSGTAALHLALLALDVGPGDEVLVPAYTFPATANVVALCGATPKLVDVDPRTMNLDLEHVASAVWRRTRAVLAVHLFGRPLDWDGLRAVIPEEIPIVEDAAGALGARSKDRPCGSLGRVGCLSFHPRKIVTTGEGGAVVTNEEVLALGVRRLRHHGIEPHGEFDIARAGLNYRLSDLLCAVGIPQVLRLEELLQARERLAQAYAGKLKNVEAPAADEGDRHGLQAYVIQLDRRDAALAALRDAGIEAQIGTYALSLLSAYRSQGSFPGAEACFRRALALPFHSRLTEQDVDRVSTIVRRFA